MIVLAKEIPTDGWEEVVSTQIEAFHYTPSVALLFIRFKGGSVYQYDSVPESIVTSFRASESKGAFAGKHIKTKFVGTKLSEPHPLADIDIFSPDEVNIATLKAELPMVLAQAQSITVSTKEEAESAVAFVSRRKSVMDRFVKWFAPIKKKSWDEHQINLEDEKSITVPNQDAIKIVKEKILAYDTMQARLVSEENERRRLKAEQEERERRAEEESERKERQRIEDEKRAQAEAKLKTEREIFEADKNAQADALAEDGKLAEAERIRKETALKAELEWLMAENRRIKEENERLEAEKKAKEALEAPIYVHVVQVAEEKIEGMNKAFSWKAEVTDIRSLCRGIADGKTPVDVIKIDQGELNKLAKSWKEKTAEHYPGIRGFEDCSIRTK